MLPVIKMFSQIKMDHVPFISHHHIVAADLNGNLTVSGKMPEGFIVTAEAFRIFLKENNLQLPLIKILEELDLQNFLNIFKIANAATQLILRNELPHQLEIQIRNAHYALCGEEINVCVTVRSSATAEDLPACGLTEQLETFVNIEGEDALINAVHKSFASLFSEKAIYDRYHKGINNADIAVSIAVEKMIQGDRASSNSEFPNHHLKSFDKIMSFKSVEEV
ncbi:MAG: hypothetical protein M3040_14470 [Bacteroidota bacterium]|nr:hypothetical protein [Bacteroidota bacterium]